MVGLTNAGTSFDCADVSLCRLNRTVRSVAQVGLPSTHEAVRYECIELPPRSICMTSAIAQDNSGLMLREPEQWNSRQDDLREYRFALSSSSAHQVWAPVISAVCFNQIARVACMPGQAVASVKLAFTGLESASSRQPSGRLSIRVSPSGKPGGRFSRL